MYQGLLALTGISVVSCVTPWMDPVCNSVQYTRHHPRRRWARGPLGEQILAIIAFIVLFNLEGHVR